MNRDSLCFIVMSILLIIFFVWLFRRLKNLPTPKINIDRNKKISEMSIKEFEFYAIGALILVYLFSGK